MYQYEKSLVKKNHSSSWDSASGSFLIESPSVGWSVLVVDSSFADFELSSLSLVVVLLSLVCDSSFGDFSTFGFGFGILLTLETYTGNMVSFVKQSTEKDCIFLKSSIVLSQTGKSTLLYLEV